MPGRTSPSTPRTTDPIKRKSIEVLPASSKEPRLARREALVAAGGSEGKKDNSSSEDDNDDQSNWTMFKDLWPIHTRKPMFRNKAVINRMKIDHIFKIIEIEEKRQKESKGNATKADEKIPTTRYKEQKDDRRTRLHDASLLRMPVTEPEDWYGKVPVARDQVFKSLPFKATGSEHTISDVAIEKIHNRSNNIFLKYFLAENITVSARPPRETRRFGDEGVELTTELAWEPANSVSQATEAVISYGCLLQQIWPYDTTAWALMRLFNRYKWLVSVQPAKTRTELIASVFNRIAKKNSLRAANREAPIVFDEMEKILRSVLVRNNQKPDIPTPGGSDQKNLHQQRVQQSRPMPSQQGGTSQRFKIPLLPTYNNNKLCFGHNDHGKTCNYSLQPGGQTCKGPRGTIFAHACSNWVASKGQYCLQTSHGKRDCRNK